MGRLTRPSTFPGNIWSTRFLWPKHLCLNRKWNHCVKTTVNANIVRICSVYDMW